MAAFSGLLLVSSVLAAAELDRAYVKDMTPLLSAPSDHDGKPLKNLEVNELLTVVYFEEQESADYSQTWVRLKAADGREGYVRLFHLSRESVPEPEFKAKHRDIEQKSFVKADALYMRSAPSRQASERGMLARNQEVTVIKYSDEDDYIDGMTAKWAFVRVDSETEGWVYGGYLSEEQVSGNHGTPNQPQEDPNHILSGSSKSVRPPWLHIRDEPSRFGTVIGAAKQGKSVRILERLDAWESLAGVRSVWVKVKVGDTIGWVYGGFLSSEGLLMASDSLDKPFIVPLDIGVYRRLSQYGMRIHPIKKTKAFHSGVDLATSKGTVIYAAADGTVEKLVDMGTAAYGLLTVVRHENGMVTYYAHQSRWRKSEGDKVKAGDVIGEVGSTGASTGPHLHFEVRTNYNDTHFNPDKYVPFPEAPPAEP